MTEIEQILSLSTEWEQDNANFNSIFQQLADSLSPEQYQPLKNFFDRLQKRVGLLGNIANYLNIRATEDLTSLDSISERLESGIQKLRQLPLSTVFNLFPRMVRDLARQQGKEIELIIEGGDISIDKKILEEIKDPLLHLIRNAIDHGIETPRARISQGKPETATLLLRGYQIGSGIGIEIKDDGRGLDLKSIEDTALRLGLHTETELAAMSETQIQSLIFASGFSTRTEVSELSGRGVGLDVVRANVERLKGTIQVNSTSGYGCQFLIRISTSLITTKVLIVETVQNLFAIPVESIENILSVSPQDILILEDSQVITYEEQPISIAWLDDLLELNPSQEHPKFKSKSLSGLILKVGSDRFCLVVDASVDLQNIVLKPQSKLLKRIPNITGATILGNGEVCMILNPSDLLHSLKKGTWQNVARRTEPIAIKNKLLLVEDSLLIRTQMVRLLKAAGYDVTVAVDGLEGWQKLQTDEFNAVVSDVEMPNMTGLELTAKVRQHSEYENLPIILVTTLASPEDKRRGTEAGANAYLTKGDFDRQHLINTLAELI